MYADEARVKNIAMQFINNDSLKERYIAALSDVGEEFSEEYIDEQIKNINIIESCFQNIVDLVRSVSSDDMEQRAIASYVMKLWREENKS